MTVICGLCEKMKIPLPAGEADIVMLCPACDEYAILQMKEAVR